MKNWFLFFLVVGGVLYSPSPHSGSTVKKTFSCGFPFRVVPTYPKGRHRQKCSGFLVVEPLRYWYTALDLSSSYLFVWFFA